MLIKTLDGDKLHVLINATDVQIMDNDANVSSVSLGAFLYALKNGLFTEVK